MKNKIFPLIVLTLSILTASCTKEVKYTKEALYTKSVAADSSTTFILPRSMSEGVSCTDYSEGCLSAHIIKVQGLEFYAIEFSSEADAILAAKKFRGYYLRNWLFDDVTGEPILEKFVSEKLEAKKP